MKRGPKRQLHSEIVPMLEPAALAASRDVEICDLIPPQPDGVIARLVTMPPCSTHSNIDPAGSAGQFHLIVEGSLVAPDRPRERWESVFASPEQGPLLLEAGDRGLQFVCLQLPRKAAEYSG